MPSCRSAAQSHPQPPYKIQPKDTASSSALKCSNPYSNTYLPATMILPKQPPSPPNEEDQTLPPPSYQDSVPSSQPQSIPTVSLYAPPTPFTPGPSYEGQREPMPRLNSLDRVAFPEPSTSIGRTSSEPPLPPPKEKEREDLRFNPAQRAFGVFSAMVSGPPNARYPNPAGPSSNTLETQDPLNPAPSAFTRPTPKNYAYLPFKPMTMISNSSNLSDGFPNIPPPVNPEDETQVGKQHPFVSHDVTEEDWLK